MPYSGINVGLLHFRTEPPKTNTFATTPSQCLNCQKFGHTSKDCTAKPTCRKCAGNHLTRECKVEQQSKCANCSGSHAASYGGCPERRKATVLSTEPPSAANPTPAPIKSYASVVSQNTKETNPQLTLDPKTIMHCLINVLCCLNMPKTANELSRLGKAVLHCSDLFGAGLSAAETNSLILSATKKCNENEPKSAN